MVDNQAGLDKTQNGKRKAVQISGAVGSHQLRLPNLQVRSAAPISCKEYQDAGH